MDNYPEHLAPELGIGGVETPFSEWWSRAAAFFPNVPEDVAEQWLHRHWSHSPYRWMPSRSYTFRLIEWECSRLSEISSGATNWEFAATVERGKQLVEEVPDHWLVRYMAEHGDVPRPIIVLDNRDGSLGAERGAPTYMRYPAGHLLIEGHKRFELTAYLFSVGRLRPSIGVWLMEGIVEAGRGP